VQEINSGEAAVILISPERMANKEFIDERLKPVADRVALLVIDEASRPGAMTSDLITAVCLVWYRCWRLLLQFSAPQPPPPPPPPTGLCPTSRNCAAVSGRPCEDLCSGSLYTCTPSRQARSMIEWRGWRKRAKA